MCNEEEAELLDFRNQMVRLKWSSVGSYAMAAVKMGVAFFSFSIFLGINALYTVVVGIGKHQSVIGMMDKKKHGAQYYYKRIGGLIFLASLLYLAYTFKLFFLNQTVRYTNISAITIATITFGEIGVSIYGIIKARKKNDLLMKAVKLLNLSSALVGLVLTQAAILSFAETKPYNGYNAISGFLFGGITLGIGLWMMCEKRKEEPEHKPEPKPLTSQQQHKSQ